ncbi:MAG: hypothetical protein Q9167_005112 [Letrouitia subvulpina]
MAPRASSMQLEEQPAFRDPPPSQIMASGKLATSPFSSFQHPCSLTTGRPPSTRRSPLPGPQPQVMGGGGKKAKGLQTLSPTAQIYSLVILRTHPVHYPGPYAPSDPLIADAVDDLYARLQRSFSHQHHKVYGNQRPTSALQCEGGRGITDPKGEACMPPGPLPPRPLSSRRPTDDRHQTLPSLNLRTLPPISDARRVGAPSPALQTKSPKALNERDPRPSQPIDMQSILNPANKEIPDRPNQGRKSDNFELPSPAPTNASRVSSTSVTRSPSTVSLPSITPPSTNDFLPPIGQGSRQILTPQSTSGLTSNPLAKPMCSGTIDAKRSPFVVSAADHNFSGSESQARSDIYSGSILPAPSYGTPTSQNQSPTGHRQGVGPLRPRDFERRPSIGSTSQAPGSLSSSPSTSHSSYGQFNRTPPTQQPVVPASRPSSAFYGPPTSSGVAPTMPHTLGSAGAYGSVSSATGQGQYRVMTLETEQGPIHVPVDVQAASKVADEKRRRNATASHRFRQRRKEKERETSQNIAKLEHQVRDMAEDSEYYRQERDYFRNLISKSPGQAHLAARPLSPRQLRINPAGSENAYTNHEWPMPDRNDPTPRNTRRRTSSYMPPPDLPHNATQPVPYSHLSQSQPTNPGSTSGGYQNALNTQAAHSYGPFESLAPPSHNPSWQPRR